MKCYINGNWMIFFVKPWFNIECSLFLPEISVDTSLLGSISKRIKQLKWLKEIVVYCINLVLPDKFSKNMIQCLEFKILSGFVHICVVVRGNYFIK